MFRRRSTAAGLAARISIVILLVLGVMAVAGRGFAVAAYLRAPPQDRSVISDADRWLLDHLGGAYGLVPSSAADYRQAEVDIAAFNERYNEHPLASYLHLIPAGVFFLLAPLQFLPRIRTRHPAFHRWSGRVLLIAALVFSMSAFYIGLLMPFGGLLESMVLTLFGGLFLFSGLRAFVAIRHGDIATHREWMIRFFAIALGISVARLVDISLMVAFQGQIRTTFVAALWIGWPMSLGTAELWIRRTRARRWPQSVRRNLVVS